MKTQAQNQEQLQYFLNNAFDLLEDVKDKMGIFQMQRYHRLKKELESTVPTAPANRVGGFQ